jgi:hypothetical protein
MRAAAGSGEDTMKSQQTGCSRAGRSVSVAVAVCTVLVGMAAWGAPKRRAVVVGSNGAAAGRTSLRYAHEDAKRMAEVLVEVGEFRQGEVSVLKDPTPEELLSAMDEQMEALRGQPGETLWLFYYSGHADQSFLYPGGRALPIEEVRKRVDTPAATVRLGIIDACRGGGWTQTKGLQAEATPFEVQVPIVLRSEGSVLIASSSGLENAHETEALRGSFFTHHLVAALRGAADQAGDGEVTVAEAFSYARERTVRDTALMGVSPQHPSFDLNLRGRGDLALTHVAAAGSVLRVKQVMGPLQVLQAGSGSQVAELPRGERWTALALPPGRYLVVSKGEGGQPRAGEVTLREQETVTLEEGSLEPVDVTPLVPKGGELPLNTLSLSLLPNGEFFVGEAFGVEFERALGPRFSVALAPYLENYGDWGAMLSWRLFVVGQAPSGFWVGVSGYGQYSMSPRESAPGINLMGQAPTAGYTFVYEYWMVSVGATPFFQWKRDHGWHFDRINTKIRANLGVAF